MSELVSLVANGCRWQVRADCQDQLFDVHGLRLEEWLRSGQARVVKHGPHRTVYHLGLPGLDCYLKHFRLADARAWLREWVRPSKARMEYERALAVARRQIPSALPIALGECCERVGPGESYLIMRGLRGTETLNHFVENTFARLPPDRQARIRQNLAVESAKIVARMHDAGMIHHDLHAGNLLVRLGDGDRVELYLIDLHALRVSRSLTWRKCRANLIMLNRWAVLRTSRTDRLRFWRAYAEARQGAIPLASGEDVRNRARDLESGTWISNLRFWRHRDRRCLRSNRYYQRVRTATTCGYAVRDLDPQVFGSLLEDPDSMFRRTDVAVLKDSRTSTVVEFGIREGGAVRRVIYKRFRVRTWSEPWVALVRRSAALRSWVFGQGLRERGLPTARPLVVLHRRRHGLSYEGYLLTEKIPDARDLHRYLSDLGDAPAAERMSRLRRLIDQVARLIGELHRRMVGHRDLKAANILMSPARCPWFAFHADRAPEPGIALQPWLIDLVGLHQYGRLPRSRRVQNLARLHASFHDHAAVTRTDKLRFLRTYLQWGVHGRGGWKQWWQDIDQATRRKIERNRRHGRPLA